MGRASLEAILKQGATQGTARGKLCALTSRSRRAKCFQDAPPSYTGAEDDNTTLKRADADYLFLDNLRARGQINEGFFLLTYILGEGDSDCSFL